MEIPPKCLHCNKEMVNAVDSRTKNISQYIWKPNCVCIGGNFRLCIG